MAATETSPLTSTYQPVTWNFKLLAHDTLAGFGGMGEGMSVQIAPDGRRIIWLAHESAPKNFTAVDVSDPKKPKVVCQTDLPHAAMRSNSLETCGNLMAVAYQTQKKDVTPAGFELFDISKPENPKSISFFDCSGPHSRGVHQLWFCDGEYVHCASGSRDFTPTHPQDDQFYRCVDVRNPSKPVEVGRWWMPGTRQGDNVMPPARHQLDKGYRAHNTNVYPQRPDRCYLAYIDGGMFVLDISDKANPKKISQWTNSPPYTGFMHTIVPLFDRGLKPTWCRSRPVRCRITPSTPRPAASAPITSTRTCRCRRRGNPTRSCSARFSTAVCAPTTSPIRSSPRKSASSCRRRRPAHRPAPSR
jgi:hypothetical protein